MSLVSWTMKIFQQLKNQSGFWENSTVLCTVCVQLDMAEKIVCCNS